MISNVFKYGYFNKYKSINDLRYFSVSDSSMQDLQFNLYESRLGRKVTIFLSHKHSDLENLQGLICFLESNYNVDIYIDSEDERMPDHTSAKTAAIIKKTITECDKFILLATNGSLQSKWCNWELGYGDSTKFSDHIAILAMDEQYHQYKGMEYFDLYPQVVINEFGHFFVHYNNVNTPLEKWLNQ